MTCDEECFLLATGLEIFNDRKEIDSAVAVDN